MLVAVNGPTPVRLTITTNVDLLYYVLFYLHPKCTPRARVARRHGHCSTVALSVGVGGLAVLRRTRPSVSNLLPPSSRCIYIAAGVGGWVFFTIGGGTGSVFGVILAEMTTLSTDSRTIDRTGHIAVLWLSH